jgi:hypothetical protein
MDHSFALKGVLLDMNTTHQMVTAHNALLVSRSSFQEQNLALKGVWRDMNTTRSGIGGMGTIQSLHTAAHAIPTSKKESQANKRAPGVR